MMTNEDAAIIKGMLRRGDKQQWIAAWFGGEINSGRVAEISTGAKFAEINAAAEEDLPPPGPYISGRAARE
jgi:hypothetical protein